MKTEANWLECPACEYRFSVPKEYLDKSGKCPKCEGIFLATDCQLPEKETASELLAPGIPKPKVLESIENEGAEDSKAVSPPIPPSKTENAPKVQAKPVGTSDYNQSYVTAEKKRTDHKQVLYLVAACCTLAIALLIGIPAIANKWLAKSNNEPTGNLDQDLPSQTPPRTEKNSKGKDPTKRKKGSGAKKPKTKKAPIKPFTREEIKQVWAGCYHCTVLVQSKTGTSNLTSHGVVISDDGKIAVCLSCVEGAESVRVRFANKDYGSEERWGKPVSATVIVNRNSSLNLAIIQIPQDTTPANFRSQPISENDRGLFPVLNNKSAQDYLRMTKLKPAKAFDDLSAAEQKSLTDLKLDPEPNDYFTLHSAKGNKTSTGAPIFDREGKLVGIHMSHDSENQSSLGIPSNSLRKLADDPTARPVEFAALKRETPDPPSNPADGKPGGNNPRGNNLSKPVSFSAAIEAMNDLNWKVTQQDSYVKAQQFSVSWWKTNSEYAKAGFDRQRKIEGLREELKTAFKENLLWPSKKIRQTINQTAVEAFKNKDDGWFACVRVLKNAVFAPPVDEQPAILVELVETQEKALLVPGDIEGLSLTGSEWIVFGLNKNKTRKNTRDGKCMVIHLSGVKKR